jgi:hypothetical protein
MHARLGRTRMFTTHATYDHPDLFKNIVEEQICSAVVAAVRALIRLVEQSDHRTNSRVNRSGEKELRLLDRLPLGGQSIFAYPRTKPRTAGIRLRLALLTSNGLMPCFKGKSL